ncbi:T9SS type A sorting domain-containing protein [Hymenobacter negativus]|uniref:T9SS type A sorting domain-containing protein n=1 Tax=Hymenobacter negativus TaxID=2795026 RepID=A0ABS3QBU6_9BACT|nr:T9SS type A sorting domain-containing protein [Hymenobacter negativus]MBO2008647.1 T9SS type A sorting domain-containing protein [Hymenobacter negativus]
MHNPLLANRLGRWLAATAFGLLAVPAAHAQLAGTKAIPGDYATVAAAITDLNTQGVGAGGVTFNIAAGYTETFASPTAGAITATGTSANPIVFQKSGTGARPVITAGVGTAALDAIISLAGSDYVTIDGLELAEAATNTTTATQMEFGIALFRPSPTNGCQNNIIRNCVVTLNKTNTGTFGIYGAASTAALATSVAATAPSGAHSNNKVDGNIITNSATGMYFTASTSTTLANYDVSNEIGVVAPNMVYNFGTTATGWGIGGNYQSAFKVVNNVVNNTLNYAGGTTAAVAASTVTSTLRGIYGNACPSASIDITGNTVTLASGATTSLMTGIDNGIGSTPASNTVNITGNTVTMTYATATTAAITGITNAGAATTVNITGNTVQNSTAAAATTATFIGITSSAGSAINLNSNTVTNNVIAGTGTMTLISSSLVSVTTPVSISNNTLTGNSKTPTGTSSSTSLLCLTLGSATTTITGNTITNNTIVTAGASTTASTLVGINSTASSTTSETLSNNVITGLSISGTSTATTHVVRGIVTAANGSSDVQTLNQNTIGSLSIASGSGAVTGISVPTGGGTGSIISRNKVYDLSATGAAASVTGLLISAGGTYTVANNLVGDLRTPAATGLLAVTGLNVAGSTAVNAYYNSISLNATSTGATFGTSGMYLSSTSTILDARNNIVVNKSTAVGTGGYSAALRRLSGTAGTAPANLATTTNNNLYYAGTPSATNLLYVEGTTTATNAQQTLIGYKSFVAARESNSVTEDVPFLSTTGTAATFLHINTAVATQLESAGTPISGITVDFDGDTRNTTTPDLGADEGTFIPLDLTGPSIQYTALGNTSSTANRTLIVTITDASGVATGANAPRLYFNKNGGAYSFVNATTVSGSTYTFTFDFSLVGGISSFDVVRYYVAAQDLAATPNISTLPFGGSGVTPPGTAFTGTANQFVIQGTLSGVYYVGTSTSPQPTRTYATLTEAASAYSNNLLGGAVTFLLLDNAYGTAETFPIAFQANASASATNTLTIRPNTGVVASTIASSGTATATIQFNGASYITLDGANTAGGTTRNLSITNANTGGGSAVQIISLGLGTGATNVALRNLNLSTASANAGIAIAAGGTTAGSAGADNDNLTIENNNIGPAFLGIYAAGSTAVSAGGLDGLAITGNTIGGATSGVGTVGSQGGFIANAVAPSITLNTVQNLTGASALYGFNFTTGVTNATVSQNTVQNLLSTGANSIGLFLGTGFTGGSVTRNKILNISANSTSGYGGKGIDVQTGSATSNLLIANNFVQITAISGWSTLSSDANVGIRLGIGSAVGGVNVYHNSVSITGTDVTASADLSAALYVGSSSTALDIRNNVFRNDVANPGSTSAKNYAIYSAAANTAFTNINYNDYFVSGARGVLGYLSSDRTTLAAIQTATAKDANSLNTDPLFQSATDLHAASAVINNAGTPIAAVTVDIDGETRSATTPDMGADEFAPVAVDIAAGILVAPAQTSTNNCFGSAEAVTVQIRNAGSTTIDFSVNPATVSVVVTGPGTPGTLAPVTINTGILAPGATQNVTLASTVNLSTAGTYSFAITATATGDGNAANNTPATAPTVVVNAPVAGTLPLTVNICRSGTALLSLVGAANGTIQLQQSTSATGTFTDITGATTATFTTPVLTQTTYYRALVTCGTNVATSNVSAVIVNDPQATVTTPLTVCAGSPATLTATAPAGSTTAFRFFTTATGGTPLAGATTTGNTTSLTTGNLTAPAQYYVEAYTPGGGSESVGLATTTTGTASLSLPSGLQFNTTGPTTFYSAVIYPIGTGTVTVSILNGPTGTEVATTPAIPVTGTGLATPVTIPLNLSLPTAVTGYVIQVKTSTGITGLIRDNPLPTGSTFPFPTSAGGFTITTGINIGSALAAYYFLYNIQVSADCVAPSRTAIQVNVNPTTTAGFTYGTASTFCVSGTTAPAVVLGTGATAGTFSSTTGLTIDPTTGAITLATSTPGTYTVTNTVPTNANQCGSTATTTVTITAAPVATFSYPTATTYCAGSTSTVTPTLGTGASTGVFSSTTGLTIDAVTGVITLATSTAGTYTVTNTIAASGACAAATATATVTITPATSAAFSYATSTLCLSGTNPTPTVTGTAGGAFSSTTGLSINATTGAINLAASTAGTYVVTYTVAGSCGSSATQTLTLTTAPVASFSYSTTSACAGSATLLTPTLGTGASAGVFSSTTGLTINATTGAVNPATSTAGTYTVTNTIAASGSCAAATSTATVTINALPATPTYTYTYPTRSTVLFTSSVAPAGTTYQWFLGSVAITGATSQTYTANGTTAPGNYTVRFISTATGCQSAASTPLAVTATNQALAGSSLTLFPNPTADGKLTLQLSGYAKPVTLSVIDALGRVVLTQQVAAGQSEAKLDLSGAASGVYMLRAVTEGGTDIRRIVRE